MPDMIECPEAPSLGPRLRMVLEMLAEAHGPVPTWRIGELVDPRYPGGDVDLARVYVMRLRRKLGDDAIQSARGEGYRLSDAGRAAASALLAA